MKSEASTVTISLDISKILSAPENTYVFDYKEAIIGGESEVKKRVREVKRHYNFFEMSFCKCKKGKNEEDFDRLQFARIVNQAELSNLINAETMERVTVQTSKALEKLKRAINSPIITELREKSRSENEPINVNSIKDSEISGGATNIGLQIASKTISLSFFMGMIFCTGLFMLSTGGAVAKVFGVGFIASGVGWLYVFQSLKRKLSKAVENQS